jgi:hypothetical protein
VNSFSTGIVVINCQLCLCLWIIDLKMLVTEQCSNIEFCVLLHRSPSETLQMLGEAYGKKTWVYEWRKCSSDGHVSVSGEPHCQLSTQQMTKTSSAFAVTSEPLAIFRNAHWFEICINLFICHTFMIT